MDEDSIDETDVRQAILRGNVIGELTNDPRGPRFLVRGLTRSRGREIETVCRFLPSGLLRIITVYELAE